MWFRRDLRLADNPAFYQAVSQFDQVVPLFIWDPCLVNASGANRVFFLAGCVGKLGRSLDGNLVVRSGDPSTTVAATAAEVGASAVFVTSDYGPYGSKRDRSVRHRLGDQVDLLTVGSPYAVEPGALYNQHGRPFRLFSAYLRAWQSHQRAAPLPATPTGTLTRAALRNTRQAPAPAVTVSLPAPGEAAALRHLDAFLTTAASRYGAQRDRVDLEGTSRLSPYLRFGCLHPRQILARLDERVSSHGGLARELCWREFFADVLFHNPAAARQPYRQEWRSFEVDTGPDADRLFAAWALGQTGYPIVDAAMRQLLAEGWVHNRARMIVASFLVKDLHLDWRRGARWFMSHLVDGDLASNQLNWQWVAGSGTDAAPFFRVFNPVTQGRKFDPDGHYIKRWVPELRQFPGGKIHEPWAHGDATPYPRPIVDHAAERYEALARYRHVGHKRAGPKRIEA
jgi:deoxyribodipyrimidine photo-lyase